MGYKMLCVVSALVLTLSACGGSDDSDGADDGDGRQAIFDWMIGQGETEESAGCFADELSDYSVEDFEVLDASDTGEGLPEGMAEAVFAAGLKCGE